MYGCEGMVIAEVDSDDVLCPGRNHSLVGGLDDKRECLDRKDRPGSQCRGALEARQAFVIGIFLGKGGQPLRRYVFDLLGPDTEYGSIGAGSDRNRYVTPMPPPSPAGVKLTMMWPPVAAVRASNST